MSHISHKLEVPNRLWVDQHSSLYGSVPDAEGSGRVPDVEFHLGVLENCAQSREGIISVIFC